MQIARKKAPAFKKLLNKEGRIFLKDALMHFIKKHALETACRKGLKRKEKVNRTCCYSLWQAKEDIVRSLAKRRSNAAKCNALKAQLNLRKQVLEQKSYLDKDLFLFSKN